MAFISACRTHMRSVSGSFINTSTNTNTVHFTKPLNTSLLQFSTLVSHSQVLSQPSLLQRRGLTLSPVSVPESSDETSLTGTLTRDNKQKRKHTKHNSVHIHIKCKLPIRIKKSRRTASVICPGSHFQSSYPKLINDKLNLV